MHHKFAVLNFKPEKKESGQETTLTGSFNWDGNTAKYNYEDIVRIKSRKIADAFYREYQHVVGKVEDSPGLAVDGDIVAAFNEHITPLLVERIQAARENITVAVYTIMASSTKWPQPVYDALVAAHDRGVKVRIMTNADKASGRQYGNLSVTRSITNKGKLHTKFIVIDGEYVVTGSYNYVTKSYLGNTENVVSIRSRAMAAAYCEQWEKMLMKLG